MIIAQNNKGFTLIELMISLVLSLIIIAAAGTIYLSGGKTYRVSEELERLQENGRYAIDRIARDIRMIGFTGCNSRSLEIKTTVMAVNFTAQDFLSNPIVGTENHSGELNSLKLQPGSDSLRVSSAAPSTAQLVGNYEPNNANIKIGSNPDNVNKGDLVMLSDCEEAHVFEVTNVTGNNNSNINVTHSGPGNSPNKIDRTYREDATLMKFASNNYFNAINPAGNPALYISDVYGNTSELVDRVQSLQFLYGESTDGNDTVDAYVVASAVTNWARVYSIRVLMLLESLDDALLDESVPISFNGTTMNTGDNADRKIRLVFSTTIAIRNRLP